MKILNFCIYCLSLLIFGSCQVYRSNFDCTPATGVPCTSVTDIEKMIVETPEGAPDIFLGYLPSQTPSCEKISNKSKSLEQRRVWVERRMQPCGTYVEGHYIYLNKRLQP